MLLVKRGRPVDGVCVHTGTISSKTLRETVPNLSGWLTVGMERPDARACIFRNLQVLETTEWE